MHDLLQKMGKNIVFEEAPSNPGRRSRLWSQEDVNNVLVKNKGTEAIQAIVLEVPRGYVAHWNPEAFSKTSDLKLLKLCSIQLPNGLKSLPGALRVLDWTYCPLKSLPLTIQLDELVNLKLCHSEIEQLWEGRKFLDGLKFINLSFSKNLIRSPDISDVPNLEVLVLKGCTSLFEAHSSLGLHKKLVVVNFKDCINLRSLPAKMEISSLEILILSGCSKIRKLPEFGGLAVLNLKNCKNLVCLPTTIHNLKSLKTLNVSGCSKISRLPENLRECKCLEELDVSETGIEEVPSCIFDLENLKVLSFEGCQGLVSKSWNWFLPFRWILGSHSVPKGFRLPHSWSTLSSLQRLNLSYCNLSEGSIPDDIDCLSSLQSLNLCGNNFVSLPSSISKLLKLEVLFLDCCEKLQVLPDLPLNIETLFACNCYALETSKFNPSKPCNVFTLSKEKVFTGNDPDAMNMFMVFQRFLQECKVLEPRFEMLIRGDMIPPWFGNQKYRSLTAVHVPRIGPQTEWVGFALCFLIYNSGYPSKDHHHEIDCYVYPNNHGATKILVTTTTLPHLELFEPHLYVLYLPGKEYREKIYTDNDCSEIEFVLKSYCCGGGIEIIGCGSRLVYQEDVEGLNMQQGKEKKQGDADAPPPNRLLRILPTIQKKIL
ncbi:hypothetical protein L6164_016890 [Bauhinia variegata]|uniref:Uncharacterized protein n=1 Tax=Bauhinia variegata TaxID=167791 RepID=A0ACB9N827_BAUVA|nr:hypothetical protein L6164_016890 [Bauhinia variegata]